MDRNKYLQFEARDFVDDPNFRRWVRLNREEDRVYWESFLLEFPNKAADIQNARAILESIITHFDVTVEDTEVEQSYQDLKSKISTTEGPSSIVPLRRWVVRVAAAIILLVGITFFLQVNPFAKKASYVTEFGEQLQFELPDGSQVVLNGNSTLTVGMWSKENREVFLEGEGYFQVSKDLEDSAKFTVHANGLDVVVLGTQFNVNSRNDLTEVALEEGSIKLDFKDADNQDMDMIPGDVVQYKVPERKVTHSQTQTVQYTSWKDGTLMFKEEFLSDVFKDLSDIYGIRYQLESEVLTSRRITGGVPLKNLELALETLRSLYGLKIEFTNGVYLITE